LRADDDALVAAVRADLATLTGITATPLDSLVVRWGGGLPQYEVGHIDRVPCVTICCHAIEKRSAAAVPKTRLAFVFFPHGVTMDKWLPATTGSGFEFTQVAVCLALAYPDATTIHSGCDR